MRILKAIILITMLTLLAGCASYAKLERIDGKYSDLESFFLDKDIPKYTGTEEGIYFDGKQWYDRSLEMINNAEDYILIYSFLTTEHQHARDIFDALKRRMDEGVRVHLIFDSASYYRAYPNSPDAIRAAIPYVEELGIPFTEYNPIRGRRVPTFLKLFDRDHRKYWIVDGKTVASGGQNIDYDSLRFPDDEQGLIDAMIEIESPGFTNEMLDSFIKSWNRYALDKLDKADFENRSADGAESFYIFNQGPSSGEVVTNMFDGFFALAEKELWMVQCYTYVTPALLDKIEYAVDRGVDVNFILSENHIGTRFDRASHFSMKTLLDAGADVYLYESPTDSLLHYKMMFADRQFASIGSANYNLRSQTTSRELSVVIDAPGSIKTVSENLEQLLEHCRVISYEEALEYQGFEYLANYILMQFWG